MGWKNIKEYYRIEHSVCVTSAGICIGSPYVTDLITISLPDTKISQRDNFRGSDDLTRYLSKMNEDPVKLNQLANSPDVFTKSIPVYTYAGAEIIEKFCEEPGWPNVTHDGCMMYDNEFSTYRDEVVRWAYQNAIACVNWRTQSVQDLREKLADAENDLEKFQADADKLAKMLPNCPGCTDPRSEGTHAEGTRQHP